MKTPVKICLSVVIVIVAACIHGFLFGKGGAFTPLALQSKFFYAVFCTLFAIALFVVPLRVLWKKNKEDKES